MKFAPCSQAAGEVGAVQTGAGEAGPAHDGMAQLRALELGLLEPCPAQVDAGHLGLREPRLGEIGAARARASGSAGGCR